MASNRRRIGLFGGSFDPVHIGHVKAARVACGWASLDSVWFVPAATSPFKAGTTMATADHRLAMIRLAIADEPDFSVSTVDLDRAGVSYALDTVRLLKTRHPDVDFSFIIGADSLVNLSKWREAHTLVGLCDFITLARPGWTFSRVPGFEGETERRLRQGIIADFAEPVSSSEIRRRVEQGESLEGLVPPAVAQYIAQNGLYRKADLA